MRLTSEHIEDLYKFTRQHYVEHYDLQTELVDHLANDIEEIWKEKPNLSFNDAKMLAFKKFGVFGFMDVIEQKQKQMSRKYWRILWSFVKGWFRLPKIVITISLIFVCYQLLQFTYAKYILFVLFIPMMLHIWMKLHAAKKNMKKKPRKWMLEDMLLLQGTVSAFILATYPLHFMGFIFEYDQTGGIETWGSSILITIMLLVIYISVEVIPLRAEKLLQETYPEYKLSQNV
jgi:cation transport ATPase